MKRTRATRKRAKHSLLCDSFSFAARVFLSFVEFGFYSSRVRMGKGKIKPNKTKDRRKDNRPAKINKNKLKI